MFGPTALCHDGITVGTLQDAKEKHGGIVLQCRVKRKMSPPREHSAVRQEKQECHTW